MLCWRSGNAYSDLRSHLRSKINYFPQLVRESYAHTSEDLSPVEPPSGDALSQVITPGYFHLKNDDEDIVLSDFRWPKIDSDLTKVGWPTGNIGGRIESNDELSWAESAFRPEPSRADRLRADNNSLELDLAEFPWATGDIG